MLGGGPVPPPTPDAVFAAHRALLEKWRKAMDLVGPGPLDPHFADAAAAVSGFVATGAWADLGSGAGFPGIALAALHLDAVVLLVERRQKRAAFLRAVVAESGLTNASVFEGDVAALAAASFDGVTSRAYKAPDLFLADGAKLLKEGGTALVLTAGSVPSSEWPLVGVERYQIEGKPRAAIRFRHEPTPSRNTPSSG